MRLYHSEANKRKKRKDGPRKKVIVEVPEIIIQLQRTTGREGWFSLCDGLVKSR